MNLPALQSFWVVLNGTEGDASWQYAAGATVTGPGASNQSWSSDSGTLGGRLIVSGPQLPGSPRGRTNGLQCPPARLGGLLQPAGGRQLRCLLRGLLLGRQGHARGSASATLGQPLQGSLPQPTLHLRGLGLRPGIRGGILRGFPHAHGLESLEGTHLRGPALGRLGKVLESGLANLGAYLRELLGV